MDVYNGLCSNDSLRVRLLDISRDSKLICSRSSCRTFGSSAPSVAVGELSATFHVSSVAAELITAVFLAAYVLGVRCKFATRVNLSNVFACSQ